MYACCITTYFILQIAPSTLLPKIIPYYILLSFLLHYIYFPSFVSKLENRQQVFVCKFGLNSLIGPNENVYIRTYGQADRIKDAGKNIS